MACMPGIYTCLRRILDAKIEPSEWDFIKGEIIDCDFEDEREIILEKSEVYHESYKF